MRGGFSAVCGVAKHVWYFYFAVKGGELQGLQDCSAFGLAL
jgi:hypothetical protein